MGCPSEFYVGENFTFSIATHDPDTGVLTDADSAPAYRIYEDDSDTAILTGTMDKIDDANTTGAYRKKIAGTAANGFEVSKTYSIYIAATVDSDTGGIVYSIKANPLTSTEMATVSSDLSYLMIGLINKMIITESSGSVEQFDDSNVSLGSIAGAITTDGTYTTRLRMVI